eukprot:EC824265.1.p1 GENE.EC824265.1~~EC824265.1.p1  ORF type:complete len:215 (+),score=76.27 EC824265.1:53-697(+)
MKQIITLLLIIFIFFSFIKADEKSCKLCKVLVQSIKDEIKQYDGKITEEFKKVVCAKFGKYEDSCKKFVDIHGILAIEWLLKQVVPEKVCKFIKLCDQTKWVEQEFTPEAVNAIIQMGENENACDICKYIIFQLEDFVNKSEPEIEKELIKVCSHLPAPYETICDTVVLMYGHQIIQLLLQKEDPKTICKQLHLCTEQIKSKNDVECYLCKFFN